MSDQPTEDDRQVVPFAAFLQEHNRGASHTKASEALQEVVNAVVDTGKKGSVVLTVSLEPMKQADEGTLLVTVNVVSKAPQEPACAAVFYADDAGNLTRKDPRQLALELEGIREVPAQAAPRTVGGER
jgi:hypothetical protein